MGAFQWACLVAAWAFTLVPGIAAVSRGWLLPWLRGRVPSPRLWGTGEITLGLGITTGMISSHWHSLASLVGTTAGLCLGLCGLGILAKAQRPS
ncbi:hypothetical protein GCM10009663_35290 [Kitasatospora arboriphila]|uniref:Uncharacterized protein n=1 Tax=Kitasatospora arboriphila TaxID=258052 RepID=A0ABN1TIF2_9ACTN